MGLNKLCDVGGLPFLLRLSPGQFVPYAADRGRVSSIGVCVCRITVTSVWNTGETGDMYGPNINPPYTASEATIQSHSDHISY